MNECIDEFHSPLSFFLKVKTIVSYQSEDNEREYISSDNIPVIVPLSVTESSIFREEW